MNILLTTLGSGGDVYPFIAIGRELVRRGHTVKLMTNPHFEAAVLAGGLPFVGLGTEAEYLEAITHADLVHPSRGPAHVLQHLVFGPAQEMYTAVRRVARQMDADAIVRHHICFGAGWAAEKERMLDIPCTLAPIFWINWRSPSVFGMVPFVLPKPLARISLAIRTLGGRWVIDRPCNVIRRELGLPPQRDMFSRNSRGTGISLGLWSPALRGPVEGDPAGGIICGAAVHDDGDEANAGNEGRRGDLPAELDAFVRTAAAPVCFTLGTSVAHHAPEFYRHAAAALATNKLRGVFVTGPGDASAAEQICAASNGAIFAAGYVPYSRLLHRCSAVVHHGGIGTVHACLKAGVPQLVVPFANDEFDNAARISRLRCGAGLRASKLSDRALSAVLGVVTSGVLRQRAKQIGQQMAAENGAVTAADCIERVAPRSETQTRES